MAVDTRGQFGQRAVAGVLLVTFGAQRFREPRVRSSLAEAEEKMNMTKCRSASSRTILIGASDDNQ